MKRLTPIKRMKDALRVLTNKYYMVAIGDSEEELEWIVYQVAEAYTKWKGEK